MPVLDGLVNMKRLPSGREGTEMSTLTTSERILRRVMLRTAQDPQHLGTLTYAELGEAASADGFNYTYPMIEPPFRGLGAALGKISTYEHALGRPLLSAMVVQLGSGQPGEGFVKLAESLGRDVTAGPEDFWQAELQAVLSFWRDDDPTRIPDAAAYRMLELLRLIRRDL